MSTPSSEQFLREISVEENNQEKLLSEIIISGKPVLIYGAGVYAYVLHSYLTARGIEVSELVVDRSFISNDNFMGLKVSAIEDFNQTLNDYIVLIGIANYHNVLRRFADQGCTNFFPFDVPDFLNIPNPFLDYDFLKNNASLLVQAQESFSDELSKATFTAALNTKLNQNLCFIDPLVRLDHLYFATTEFPLTSEETLLDVGGFNGDSIRDFYKITEGRFRSIVSLEPFPKTYKQLQQTVRELSIESRAKTIAKGAWNTQGHLSFQNTELDIDSKIQTDGHSEIEVDTIDNIISDLEEHVTYMKFDINGAEFQALEGCRSTIQVQRPTLAVKMHVKEDFYRIPLLLKEIAPDINLYLRQRNYMSMMLVLYGTFKTLRVN